MNYKPLLLFIFIGINGLHAESSEFTLIQCIEYAWLNNSDVRLSMLNSEISKVDKTQSLTNMLPTLSANAGQNYQFGRTIDRFTNQYSKQTVSSTNFGINGNLVLFNGLQNQNTVKQKESLEQASEENIQTIKNQIALSVANAFLLVIQAEEIIKFSELQIQTTEQRIIKAQKMVDAGASDLTVLLSLKAQVANEKLNLVNAQNSKNSSIFNLKALMQMSPEKDLNLALPEIPMEIMSNIYSVNELYAIALQNMPQIKYAVLQSEAAKFQKMISKGNWSPTISLYGSVSTVYSQSAKTPNGYTIIGTQAIGYTQTSNEVVLQPVYSYQFSTIGFNQQLKNNLGQGAGITLSWNLFSGFQVQNQIRKSEINRQISEINLLKAKNTLLIEIGTALNNYNASKAKFDAARNNIDAQKQSYEYIQKRFDAGAGTSFDFIQAKNSYLQSISSEVQARYELVFRGLILEYYKGNPIKL